MSKTRHIENMVHTLYAAIGSNDWHGMAVADHELAGVLSALSEKGAWAASDLPALAKLREAHREAQEHCARELEKAGKRLEEMRESKEGWIAYALDNNEEEVKS